MSLSDELINDENIDMKFLQVEDVREAVRELKDWIEFHIGEKLGLLTLNHEFKDKIDEIFGEKLT